MTTTGKKAATGQGRSAFPIGYERGLTKREYMATQIMANAGQMHSPEDEAEWAVKAADALLGKLALTEGKDTVPRP